MMLPPPTRIEDVVMDDCFAGGGGVTQGAKDAGLQVAWAVNDWELAVKVHSRKHPEVAHACQDVHRVNWRRVPPCHILWASPSCQPHSESAQPARAANQDLRACHDEMRMSSWGVVDAVENLHPYAFVVENVVPFLRWNKLEEWLSCLRKEGYHITIQVLTASYWGVPQERERVIIVGRLEAPLTIVEPFLLHEAKPAIGPVLDFEAGLWKPIRKIEKPAARARARHADRVFGGKPCWGQHVSHVGGWAKPLTQPCTTITTQNQHYLVRDGGYRLWLVEETEQAQGFERGYFEGVGRTDANVLAGNAVPPGMAKGVLQQVAESLIAA